MTLACSSSYILTGYVQFIVFCMYFDEVFAFSPLFHFLVEMLSLNYIQLCQTQHQFVLIVSKCE